MPKKSQKSLGDSPASLRRLSRKCLESVFGVFRDYLDTFGGPGASGPERHFRDFFGISGPEGLRDLCKGRALSGTKIASQNRSDHGSREQACNHSAAEIAWFFALLANPKKNRNPLAIFGVSPQNRRKLAATTVASRHSRPISRPQRPRDRSTL